MSVKKIRSIGRPNQKISMETLPSVKKKRFKHSSLWTTVAEGNSTSAGTFLRLVEGSSIVAGSTLVESSSTGTGTGAGTFLA